MPQDRVSVEHTETYVGALLEIPSDRTLGHIQMLEAQLAPFPDMGSPMLRPALVARFGEGLRKLVVDGYVLVYRHVDDKVDMLAVVPGRSIA